MNKKEEEEAEAKRIAEEEKTQAEAKEAAAAAAAKAKIALKIGHVSIALPPQRTNPQVLYCLRSNRLMSAPLLNSHLPLPHRRRRVAAKAIPYNFADSSIGSKASSIASASSSISPLPSSDLALDTSMARADFKKELVHSL